MEKMRYIFSIYTNNKNKKIIERKGDLMMMKSKKLVLVFGLVIALLLLVIVPSVQATDDNPLQIINGQSNNEQANDEANNETNNVVNNEENTVPVINNTQNTASTNTLPQTGVAEDTALFVFIAICIVSAIYAYIKIRNYKNL